MYLSRVRIANFRNFRLLDVELAGNVVIVGENRVGKSNFLHALRLLLDPSLPDSARQLSMADFWDGLEERSRNHKIVVSVEIKDFEEDWDVLALLTDYRLNDDPHTVRLTYEFRMRPDLEGDPASEADYTFLCYGGEDDAKEFGYSLRRRISMDLLPALRDAEGDLGAWRRSPIRPLLEKAFSTIDVGVLTKIGAAIEGASGQITALDSVRNLESSVADAVSSMAGPRQDVKPRLGFSTVDVNRLYRNIRLLIDGGKRGISDASLGSANLMFLALKALQLHQQIADSDRNHTLLAIEEPEAHLHPHLQRSVYRRLFEGFADNANGALSILLTTHSPHLASVAPLRSIVLLKDTRDGGTVAYSTAGLELSEHEAEDLARYLDVTRAEILFARGVILVEGDAERFLVPKFAEAMGVHLDQLGISVCSVAGTHFATYVKFIMALGIPCAIITDWDPGGQTPRGMTRARNLIRILEQGEARPVRDRVSDADEATLRNLAEACGIFLNHHTLEVDLFRDGFAREILATLREAGLTPRQRELTDDWEADPTSLDVRSFRDMLDGTGKGRFAQRLASRINGAEPPEYIRKAIAFVAKHV